LENFNEKRKLANENFKNEKKQELKVKIDKQ